MVVGNLAMEWLVLYQNFQQMFALFKIGAYFKFECFLKTFCLIFHFSHKGSLYNQKQFKLKFLMLDRILFDTAVSEQL